MEKDEERLRSLIDEVSTAETSSESEYEADSSDLTSNDTRKGTDDKGDAENFPENEGNYSDQDNNQFLDENDDLWYEDIKDIPNFNFHSTTSGVKFPIDDKMTPLDIFSKVFDNDTMDIVANSTNEYAKNLTAQSRPYTRHSRKAVFKPTNFEEIKIFLLGVITGTNSLSFRKKIIYL